MPDYFSDIIEQIELHSVDGIRNCFENGVSPDAVFKNQPLIYELISEYTRSPRFKDCIKLFVEYGLKFNDNVLLAVLLNDAIALESEIKKEKNAVTKKYSLRCAYTPLHNITLLHICAEFNHVNCAAVLIKYGADVNAAAGVDENGFGGHTPIFHTVNQNNNQSADMLNFLLEHGARLDVFVKGIIWGKGYDWETFIPAVTPTSYAMMGLLPQMHRSQQTIAVVISQLVKHAYGINYTPPNIPNKYLL
jgi:Ankyrin repeat